jgi:predicted MFS family arabinose efflux permease
VTPDAARPTTTRMPLVVYVLAVGTFLMGTSEFVVAGLLTEMAADFGTTVAHAGLSITVFAVGMIVGAPLMTLATIRLPRRLTLSGALILFAAGHVMVAGTGSFDLLLAARFVTALATGAFWSVGSVAAAQTVGPAIASRALGLVLGGGMLATVLGVPLGSSTAHVIGWRGTFWALAAMAVAAAAAVALLVPAESSGRQTPSIRAELAALRDGRLWLTLATCALANAGVLSVYSYVALLITDRAGLPTSMVAVALLLFGVGALVGNVVGGRSGDTRPFATIFTALAVTFVAIAGLWAASSHAMALLALFTVLGLVGMSASPVLVSLAISYGGNAPTLAGAMPTSLFNLGTAVGTAITGAALGTGLGASAPPAVGTVFAALVFVPLGALALRERAPTRGP